MSLPSSHARKIEPTQAAAPARRDDEGAGMEGSGQGAVEAVPRPALGARHVAIVRVTAAATMASHWSMVRSRGHYPSHVVVGGVVGIAVAVAAWRLWAQATRSKGDA